MIFFTAEQQQNSFGLPGNLAETGSKMDLAGRISVVYICQFLHHINRLPVENRGT
jgi:hypothetical protein